VRYYYGLNHLDVQFVFLVYFNMQLIGTSM